MKHASKYLLFIVLNLLTFLSITFLVSQNITQSFDLQITHLVQSLTFPGLEPIMQGVSWIGYPPQTFKITMGILVVTALILGWKTSVLSQGASSGAYLLGNYFKHLLNRMRPENFGVTPWQRLLEGGTRSFPAGHVEIFTALCLVIVTAAGRKWPKKISKPFQIIVILYLILLGISRVYLGEHWATDVIAAYTVGLSWWGLFMLLFPNYGQKSTKQPKV